VWQESAELGQSFGILENGGREMVGKGSASVQSYRKWQRRLSLGFQRAMTFGAWVWARRERPTAEWLRG
jgi:hypothetical protein